ncbi:hypothetical protein CERZMDRAFT_34861 [Cercospora zeae-maydis SCOH1-5]|uniref:AB hydrolase-1 domain-containing protein n=1 Tax=Cercospora zeae-maydis SCOH1-5 TaxID=717836 RepID=A0A6A6FQR1_9PEZI|nr:hypothetical protein CERZMDRAFT_34861 [Cercospora zeae-maydis SCOH1-5]
MNHLQQKSHQAPSGVKYNYYTSAAQPSKPTILLCHGCPDSSALWTDLTRNHLVAHGFGVVVPDLIGYGLSDKPHDVKCYAMDRISTDLISILDAEDLTQVLTLGHDFGALVSSKLLTYHPERISGLITLGTTHVPPSRERFEFDKIREMQERVQGYCSGWYFPLFTSDTGYEVMDAHVDRMFTALHGGGERMKEVCCYPDAFEKWLKDGGSDGTETVLPYAASDEFRKQWIGRLERDGFRAPMLWYKAVVSSLTLQSDRNALEAGNLVVRAPYLFIAALKDPLAPAVAIEGLKAHGLLPDVTVKQVDASHWLMLEKPQEIGEAIVGWLMERF